LKRLLGLNHRVSKVLRFASLAQAASTITSANFFISFDLESSFIMATAIQEGTYSLGDFLLQNGSMLRQAKLSWLTHGTLSTKKDNIIVYPTSYP
jgi:homoserine acetyltransferase